MNVRGDNTILHISRILKNYSQRNMDTKKSFDSTRISSMGQRIKKKKSPFNSKKYIKIQK